MKSKAYARARACASVARNLVCVGAKRFFTSGTIACLLRLSDDVGLRRGGTSRLFAGAGEARWLQPDEAREPERRRQHEQQLQR